MERHLTLTGINDKLILAPVERPQQTKGGLFLPNFKMKAVETASDIKCEVDAHRVMTECEESELDTMWDDLANTTHFRIPMEVTASSMRLYIVIGENPEVDKKVAGFPAFGDLVMARSDCGADSTAIPKLCYDSGTLNHYFVCSQDKTRVLRINRSTVPVIIDWQDIVGLVLTHEEMQKLKAESSCSHS